jgi:hypothetical protein
MTRWRALLLCTAGCGRIDFASSTPGGGAQSVLMLDRVAVPRALIGIPVLVVLDDDRADRHAMCGDGSDLRFYDAAGQLLPHEIEAAGAPGAAPLLAWVRLPELVGTHTQLRVTYGSDELPPPSSDPVFDAPYTAVLHFGETTSELRDATDQDHNVVAFGTASIPAPIGLGRGFVRAHRDSIEIAPAPDLAFAELTVSGWINEPALPAAGDLHALASREHNADGDDVFWLGDAGGNYRGGVTIVPGGGDPVQIDVDGGAATAGVWTHLALAVSSTAATLFVDGHPIGHADLTSPPDDDTRRPIYVGAADDSLAGPPPGDDLLDGTLDEVRLERTARDGDWLLIDDLAMRDALISYGPVVHAPGTPAADRCAAR